MAIIKCSICNKYYDNSNYDICPYCSNSFAFDLSLDSNRNEKTIPLDFEQTVQKTEAYFDNVDDNEKTIGLFFQENEFNPVTGWIICVKGAVKGKSFEVHMNRNFLGRDKLMDICIPDDTKISRHNHMSITYDYKHNSFFAKSETGTLKVNGKDASSPVIIKNGDKLEFGESEYIFIPYCNEKRSWNNE